MFTREYYRRKARKCGHIPRINNWTFWVCNIDCFGVYVMSNGDCGSDLEGILKELLIF